MSRWPDPYDDLYGAYEKKRRLALLKKQKGVQAFQAQLAAQQQWLGGMSNYTSGTTNVTASLSPNYPPPMQGLAAPLKPDGPLDWLRKRVEEITTFAFSEVAA